MTCLALLLSIQNLQAQKTLEYGIGMGLNYTNLIETNNKIESTITKYSGKLSPSVFCRAEYNAYPKLRFTLDPTILFTLAEEDDSDSLITVDEKTHIEGVYISSPIKAHFNVIQNFWASAGLSYSYLVNLSAKREEVTSKLNNIVDNRNLVSWQLGVNYNIRNWVELAVNYSRDINGLYSLIHTDANGLVVSDGRVKNQMIQFTVSISH